MLEEIPTLIGDIRVSLSSHVKRDANKVADYLSNYNIENSNMPLDAVWNGQILDVVHKTCTTLSLQDTSNHSDGVTRD